VFVVYEDSSAGIGLLICPIREHYLVFEPPDAELVVAVIRQRWDIPRNSKRFQALKLLTNATSSVWQEIPSFR
jgi:hypothetical protein